MMDTSPETFGSVRHSNASLTSDATAVAECLSDPTPGAVNYIMESTAAPVPLDTMIKNVKRSLLISRL